MPYIADDFHAIRARQVDPVVALAEERRRLTAGLEAAVGGLDADEMAAAVERADECIAGLDDKIAGIVATSAAGIFGQIEVLREIDKNDFSVGGGGPTDAAECADRLMASIKAGIERLAGEAEAR